MKKEFVFGNVRICAISENVIRIEEAKDGKFVDEKTLFAVNRDFDGAGDISLTADGLGVKIATPYMEFTYINDGKGLTGDNLFAKIKDGADWFHGKENGGNLGGTLSTLDYVKPFSPLDDGLISTDGWYVVDDSEKPILKDGWIAPRDSGSVTDIYLFAYGRDFKRALSALTYVSGKIAFPRKYIFGSWYSRWWPYTDTEILDIVKGYDDNGFPLDVLVIDMDWHYNDWTMGSDEERKADSHNATTGFGHANNLGWTGYSWNKRLIPAPQKLLATLHKDSIYVTLNDHPADGIRPHEDCYPEFAKIMGLSGDVTVPFDASDKKYMDAVFASAHTPLENMGVDFWWVDWQQDQIIPYLKAVPNTRHLPWLNHIYYEHSKRDGKRGLGFSRWGGFGNQKQPIYFSGDTESDWDMIKYQVEFNIKSGNVGCLYWAHDLGGFYGERNPEMYVRWIQFGLTNATLRVHSQRDEALDRCPWKWGEREGEAMRRVYRLRSRLMPYIYSIAYNSFDTSEPFIKGMYFEYPSEKKAYENMQQYFFGDAFIAAPIVTAGEGEDKTASQRVWIKEGTWYNIFDNKCYTGEGEYEITCDLMSTPLLARGGMPIPMQPYKKRMASGVVDELEILCYPEGDGVKRTFNLYEDDGVSDKHECGEYLKTDISYQNTNGEICISLVPHGAGYASMPKTRTVKIILPITEKMQCTDKGVVCEYNENERCNTFSLSADTNKAIDLHFVPNV